MRTGWFRDTPRGEDDLCPNCCTPWKCNGPHLDEYQVIDLRSSAFGAIRRAAALARQADREAFDWMDDPYNESYAMARGIRMAIRAAIGSDKR